MTMQDAARTGAARCGFGVPQMASGPAAIDSLRRVAEMAEAAGCADIWVSDATGGGDQLDALSVLAYLAGVTHRVRLGVSVLVIPVHHPVHLAKRIASIDVLCGGRLTAGFGMGNSWDAGYGVPVEQRLALFNDVFRATDALLRHQPADYRGERYTLSESSFGPGSVQHPRPPIWFGSTAEPAVRRAARQADGWMGSGGSDIEAFEQNSSVVHEELERAGRDPSRFPISKRVYFAFDNGARDPSWSRSTVHWQTTDECVEYVGRLFRAGADHVLLNPVDRFEQQLEAVLPAISQL